jgi:uncharacterized Zn finger protein
MIQTYTDQWCRDCGGEREHRVLGFNSVTKPILKCEDCGNTFAGPLGAADPARPRPGDVLSD